MNYTHPTYKIMVGLFLNILKSVKSVDMIDYGCGSGYLLNILPVKKIRRYWGLETSVQAIKSAQNLFGSNPSKAFSLINTQKPLKLPSKNVDVIIAIGVLQYMTDRQINEFLIQSSKVLKKGGHLLISCVSDHWFYKFINLYGLLIPNRFIKRKWLTRKITAESFNIVTNFEKGLVFGPLFYHNIVIFFDLLDKIIFRTKGTLGLFGRASRKVAYFIADFEYLMPVDFGYTLYIDAIKK